MNCLINSHDHAGLINCVWPVDPMLNWRSTSSPTTATRSRWAQKFVGSFLCTFMGLVSWTLKNKASYKFHRTTTLFKNFEYNISFVPWIASLCHVIEGSTTEGLLLLLKKMTDLNRMQQLLLKKSSFDEIGKTVKNSIPAKCPTCSTWKNTPLIKFGKTVENIILAQCAT